MKYLMLATIAMLCTSCSSSPAPKVVVAPPSAEGPIITRIVRRNEVVIIRAGRVGPTYTVHTLAGAVIVKDVTLTELAQADPKMFNDIQRLNQSVVLAGEPFAHQSLMMSPQLAIPTGGENFISSPDIINQISSGEVRVGQ